MSPRAEFIGSSLLVATVLTVGVALLLGAERQAGMRDVASALRIAPAALLSAGMGAWFATRWHARALSTGRHWKAGGMTLRTLLLVFLLFPVALVVWALVALAIDQLAAASPGNPRETLAWLPVIIFYGSLAALVFGAAPAFILEYFACRRYLRRQAVPSTDHA
ncbi:hypothetical protein [Pseudoxanthomonas sp.]|uniref:hypothetical protein n=1 Tax=Pseudoxanthomonas sp. TaxID=1871049 RepID=UPI002FE2842F